MLARCTHSDMLPVCDPHTLFRDRRYSSVNREQTAYMKHTDWPFHSCLPVIDQRPFDLQQETRCAHKPANFGRARSDVALNSCPRLKTFCLEFLFLERAKDPCTKCHQQMNQMWRSARSESR